MALALQGHGLVGHNRHIQLFSKDAGGHCRGDRRGTLSGMLRDSQDRPRLRHLATSNARSKP
jgi:hypothetical protein